MIETTLSDMSFVPLQQFHSMASNENLQIGTAAQAPTYVFITGANPDVKLPSFQLGGINPISL